MRFTNSELENLIRIENHRINWDGNEYNWYANKGNGFELHSVIKRDCPKKTFAIIMFWIAKYNKELNEINFRNEHNLITDAYNHRKIFKIINCSYLKTFEKIRRVLEIYPFAAPYELINYGLPRTSVYRFLRQ